MLQVGQDETGLHTSRQARSSRVLGRVKKKEKQIKKKSWGKRQLAWSRVAQAPDVQTSTYLAELSSDVDIFFDGFED